MSQHTGRSLARLVLRRVQKDKAFASLVLASELGHSDLPQNERALATELVYGVLRHRSRLDACLAAMARKKLKVSTAVLDVLRVAAYQILELDRIPDHAAVDDAVNETRRIAGAKVAGFANGLLRNLCRNGEPAIEAATERESLAIRHSMPEWICVEIDKRLDEGARGEAMAALNQAPDTVVRIRDSSGSELLHELSDQYPNAEINQHAWLPNALTLHSAGNPTSWPCWKEGRVVVQDAAAQLVGWLVDPEAKTILDVCAGVGGKSIHAADRAPAATIDAVDRSGQKLELLQKSVATLGLTSIKTHVIDALAQAKSEFGLYDVVIVDAPCSGLGVLRRHPELKWTDDIRKPSEFADIQLGLLRFAKKHVKPGGSLIYSVCTFTEDEGPGVVERYLSESNEFIKDMPSGVQDGVNWDVFVGESGAVETWPHQHNADGFFALRMRHEAQK